MFDGEIRRVLGTKPEVMNFVLNHERKSKCIENIMQQVFIIEKRRLKMSPITMRRLIGDVARTFAKAALTEKEQQLMSEAQKRALTAQQDYIKDAESTFLKDNEKEALSTAHKVFVPGKRENT